MNPTGRGIRVDAGGSGHFRAPRKKIVQGRTVRYRHEGVDYECAPGQKVWMPCTGKITRVAYPYADMSYQGVEIEARRMTIKIFYVQPFDGVIDKVLKIGVPFGIAQDISKKYFEFGVTPHVHVGVVQIDPEWVFGNIETNL